MDKGDKVVLFDDYASYGSKIPVTIGKMYQVLETRMSDVYLFKLQEVKILDDDNQERWLLAGRFKYPLTNYGKCDITVS